MAQPVDAPAPGSATRKKRNPLVRGIFLVLGFVCLGLVPLSFLPGIPTFDLVLLAAFFFSMSSERMHDWMLNHRYFGKMIRGYREYGLTVRVKWFAALAIALSLALSAVFLTDSGLLRLILGAVGIYAVWFVFSRPTRPPDATI